MVQNKSSIESLVNELNALLANSQKIIITTHESPDCDGIGAAIGLSHYLHELKKEVKIVVTPRVPQYLAFMNSQNLIESFDVNGEHKNLYLWPDLWIVVDACEPSRLGALCSVFKNSMATKICIDHHIKEDNINIHFDHEIIYADYSACAELIFDIIIGNIQLPLPLEIAEALYAGIMDDTGNFRFSSTTAKVHRIVAYLIEQGVVPTQIYERLYHQARPEKIRLFGQALNNMILLDNNRYARFSIAQSDFSKLGASNNDLKGLVTYPLEIRDVEVTCLLYELLNGQIKASLRSKGNVDVNAICRKFGGGGHKLASGVKINGPMSKAEADIDMAILSQIKIDLDYQKT